VGVGIQQIETSLQKIYPNSMRILRIDGDVREKTTDLYDKIDTSDIILSTSIGSSIVH
jgi:primosomal protein N'